MQKQVPLVKETLPATFEPMEIEQRVREFWDSVALRSLVQKALSSVEPLGYVEGPPTLNGEPHIGHIRGRAYKDCWYRYSTLRKHNIVFRAGWDTQGLPVELQAERELGLTGSKTENLKQIGEEALVNACKKLISKYHSTWMEADRLLGMSLDYDRGYWTYKDEYIEREWKYLQKAWNAGLLGEGYRVIAYCPSCQTSLSHAEVGQGYEMVEDPSLYFKVKLRDEDAHLILWTTMPFTIVTDELVGAKPDADYSYVRVGEETWVVAAERLQALMLELGIKEFSIFKTVKGAQLESLRYEHPLLDNLPGLTSLRNSGKVHFVVAEEFVDTSTGSGLVHMSPANGEEDFEVATKRGVPIFSPIDDEVRFTKEAGVFAGLFVRDADQKVAELLRNRGALLKLDKITHEYPTCWRSHHKLVWLARREYFYWLDRIGEQLLQAAEEVEYFYEAPKERFLSLIKEKVPWCISRERIWGTPLPIWKCDNCSHKTAVFSRSELLANALDLPDGMNFELHRPWLDRVVLRCEKCGGPARREPFVLDTWHNSGASPYASFTDKEHKRLVPVEFLTEGIDQTRGWALRLLHLNVILTGKPLPPYKAFLFQGHALDEKGRSMHKSLGNVIEGLPTLKQNSADVLRFYIMWKSAPVENLSFSSKEMKARPYQLLSTLYHLHVYFQQNSSYDNFNPETHGLNWARKFRLLRTPELWLLSILQGVVKTVTEAYETSQYHEALKALENFVIESLSQKYVPMTRNELWEDNPRTLNRRYTIYATLKEALKAAIIMLQPVCPYSTEYLYQNVHRSEALETKTVLLQDWPKPHGRFVNRKLDTELVLVTELLSVTNAARMKARIKRRWPLKKAFYLVNHNELAVVRKHARLLGEQSNVERVVATSNPALIPMKISIRPNLEALGPRVRDRVNELQQKLSRLDGASVLRRFRNGLKVRISVGGEMFSLSKDELIVEFESDAKHSVAERDDRVVSLDIRRDKRLIAAGIVKDLARRMQSLRKERGYTPTQVLDSAFVSGLDEETMELLKGREKELAFLVRVKRVKMLKEPVRGITWHESELDGKSIRISVE